MNAVLELRVWWVQNPWGAHSEKKNINNLQLIERLFWLFSLLTSATVFSQQFIRDIPHTEIGVDLHRMQVVEPVDQGGHFGELLLERVRYVVGRVGRDEEDTAAMFGQLDR